MSFDAFAGAALSIPGALSASQIVYTHLGFEMRSDCPSDPTACTLPIILASNGSNVEIVDPTSAVVGVSLDPPVVARFPVTLPVNTHFSVRLALQMDQYAYTFTLPGALFDPDGSFGDLHAVAQVVGEVSLSNTLTFPLSEVVALLPEGYTLNSVDARIVDNMVVPVPELSTSLLVAFGVVALAAIRRWFHRTAQAACAGICPETGSSSGIGSAATLGRSAPPLPSA